MLFRSRELQQEVKERILALARAFLCQPQLLILDEATSNLDLLSESLIEIALDNLLDGRTAIIVAHRIATAMRADRIAVVDNGSILEIGTHRELVASKGKYATMYKTWWLAFLVNFQKNMVRIVQVMEIEKKT